MTRHRLPFILIFAFFTQIAPAQDTKAAAAQDPVSAADTLYKAGKLDEAARLYEALLATAPGMVHVRVGLMNVRLRQQRADDAYALGKAGLALPVFTSELLAEMGEVQFRRGEMGDAGDQYFHALKVDSKNLHAHLGLARLYGSYSMYRKSYDQLKAAHELAPNDPEVQREWFRMLPRKERLQSLEAYLASTHSDDQDETLGLTEYAKYLKATADKPVHACRLISKVEKMETPLFLLLSDANHTRGYGLQVKLNDRSYKLMLDTGASGILISRKAAERAGLERIAHLSLGGIGDKGLQSGYSALAKHIRIGQLEFEDCVVRVTDRTSVVDEDGLIGGDVFSSFLVDLDGPGNLLRLSPLPKRPDDATTATTLNTDDDSENEDEAVKADDGNKNKADTRLPKDRYIAPEMSTWTKVFRIGHQLLIPTHVNDSRSMLFLIDTGSFSNMISTTAARKVSKVFKNDLMIVRGLNGTVDKVYLADKAKLQFSRFEQQNQDITTIDLSNLSKGDGTEVSGMLGFLMLRWLDMKIDYRDGLVDFSYNPKLVPSFMR